MKCLTQDYMYKEVKIVKKKVKQVKKDISTLLVKKHIST